MINLIIYCLPNNENAIVSDHGDGSYADGNWHRMEFHATANEIEQKIDDKHFLTTGVFNFVSSKDFYIGGEWMI